MATRFELRLHPIGPTVMAGLLIYPAPMAAAVLRNFDEVMAHAPDAVGSGVALLTAPHEDFVPEPVRGQPVVGVVAAYAGPVEEAEEALRPLREFGPPALDMVEPMPYVALQQLFDADYPPGMRHYWTGDFLTGLPDEAIDVLCRFHLSKPSPGTEILLLPDGGAGARVPDGAMAIEPHDGAVQHPHHLAVGGPGRRRGQHRLDARAQRGAQAVHDRPRLRELHRRRGRGAGRRLVRRRRLPAPAGAQGPL